MAIEKSIHTVDGSELDNETFFASGEVKKGVILRLFNHVLRNYELEHAKKQPSEWIYTSKGRHKNPNTEPVDYTETVQGYHFNFKDYGDVPLTQDTETAQKYAEENNLDAVVLGFVNAKGDAQVAGVYIATDEPLRYNFSKELNKNTPEVDPTKFNISFKPVYTDILYHGTGNKELVTELTPNYIADPKVSDCKAIFFYSRQ